MYVDYQLHIPQTPIFKETQVACIPYQQKLCDVSIFGCFSESRVGGNLSFRAR